MQDYLDKYEEVLLQFKRRAKRREFPAMRYIIYLNFSTVIALDGHIIDALLRYGSDTLYPKLRWTDKLQVLDVCNRGDAPYKYRVFNKIAIDIMLAHYNNLALDMNLESII